MTNDTGNGGGTGAKSGKMDSRIGLEYIVENSDYVNKLGLALDTSNATVKKQVFELLSALCAYSSNGYKRAIETLEYYKNIKGERYRLNLVVVELDKATSVEYQIALLAFINCVIISAATLQDRIRMRNEFIGLNLLPVLNNLRRIASNVPDIGVQIDVFDEQRECDESQSLQGPDGINLNSHLDVFYAILRQVAGTPQEIPFLSILQHLLQIDPKEPISDIVWDTAETLVHRATLLEDKEASVRLLRSPSIQKFACPHCRSDITSPTRRQSVGAPLTPGPGHTQQTTTIPGAPAPPPPPPPPNLAAAAAPPPPPPPPCAPPPPPPLMAGGPAAPRGGGPPVPPAPPAPNLLSVKANEYARPKTPEAPVEVIKPLPQQETPVPRAKMKTINWNKIPPQKVFGKPNIWSIVADSHQDSPMADLNWDEMEGLFCLQQTQGSPKLGRENSGNSDTLERKSRKENEITLLDGKRSLNVNIFLKQFRSSNEDIIQLIRNGEHEDIGAEKLRGLLKILPEVDELEMLKAFDGDNNRLGNAEKFLLQLIQVPNYKLRIEGMLLKEEFKANLIYLEPNINAMLYAGEDLMNNKALQEVLYMVVVAGNFLNSGGYAGNAAGVKLSSLQKLTDIRANKPGMNLIHFVALQAEKKNCELLEFPGQMSTLENAAKTTVEQISNEINAIDQRIKKIKRQIELPKTEEDIKYQMVDFINASERDIVMLQRGLKELEAMRLQLADFFCEDVASFKMEECFKIFHNFCEKFSQAVKDNEKRRVQEEQALVRRKQREEQLALKRRQSNQPGTPVSDSENSLLLLDPSQYDMRYSPAMSRRRIGSFTSNGEPVMLREDCASPDITPNGSLRRRRSRVLSEEDEGNLMDFLRSSGHENGSRERKSVSSYGGSLDRSWARRARSGSGSKKRPDLLNVDFGTDRERPSSPSPLAESKPLPVEENKPRISREWRQKIESWLQANEADEKQNDDYKKKRKLLAVNRRSYETDNESDRGGSKLDPLPEEKPSGTATSSPEKPESGGGAGMGASSLQSPTTYKRVYPDWKPSSALEKTDVVGTMEAIADAIPSSQDKSAWRKSSLNSHQEDLDARRYRRQRSRENAAPSSSLQSILEEDKRKSVIQSLGERPPSDRLQIYIRRGSDNGSQPESTVTSPKQASSSEDNKQSIYIRQQMTAADSASAAAAKPKPTEKQSSIYIRPTTTTTNTSDNTPSTTISSVNSSCTSTSDTNQLGESSSTAAPAVVAPPPRRARRTHHIYDEKTNNKIEIDSDNIETPPSIRKSFSRDRDQTVSSANSCRKIHDQKGEGDVKGQASGQAEPEVLGDGQFDRFSLTRRTRRFKRPVDMSSGNETTSPESLPDNPLLSSDVPVRSPVVSAVAEIESTEKQKELRLKRWQDKLNNPGAASESKGSEALARAARTGRNMSRISQEDVRKAIRSLKSPTPERSWSPPKEIGTVKLITHELNDEGFEETQSLVSDTPSHGKDSTSSCNDYGSDSKNNNNNTKKSAVKSVESSPRRQLPVRSAGSALPSILITKNTNQSALERSKSLRGTPPSLVNKNLLPRRTNSMRKSESPLAATSSPTAKLQHQLDVERSNSRTSLRSSRSSLSSAVSTNTVKKVPLRPKSSPLSGTTSGLPTSSLSLHSSPSKRPLSANSARTPLSGTPASRSSSSGSSIGPSAVAKKPPLKATSGVGPSTSFKENQNQNTVTAARSRLQSKTPSNTSIAGGGASSTSSGSTTRMAAASSSSSSRVGGATNAAGSGSRTGGFMRPTTSSATKVKGK